jgi:hypothetical protein
MSNTQFVTLVAQGGTPFRICNVDGSPLPTTGSGSLVFANGGTLTNVTLVAPTITMLSLGGPTITGTVAGSATYSTPTLTAPTITGTVAGGATYNSPVLVAPALGTPVSGNLANCTGIDVTSATGLLPGVVGGTGVANSGKTITLGGNVVTGGAMTVSGAHALTFTITADTSVTLPTSGTLASINSSNSWSGTQTFQGIGETVVSVSISAGTLQLDASQGTIFACTSNANITTFQIINLPTGGAVTLYLTADGNSYSQAWSPVKWAGGIAPLLTTTLNKVDVLTFTTKDGSTIYGFTGGLNF